jgi:inosine-uridine nucleoside N-ribohydrolase
VLPTPILIDTDMGVDDAMALALACCEPSLDVVAVCAVGGNVNVRQAFENAWRVLSSLGATTDITVAKGLDQSGKLLDATGVFGCDGLGESDVPAPQIKPVADLMETYRRAIEVFGEELTIVAIGPLTNLAAVHREAPGLFDRVGRIVVMGGAIWVPGNVSKRAAEFNFYRDPKAAAEVLSWGVPTRLVPLDLTRQLRFDESHLARLEKRDIASTRLLSKILPYPMTHASESPAGSFLIHDVLAVATLIWPELFLETELTVEITVKGAKRGKSSPALAQRDRRPLRVVASVDAPELLENLLERLCQEHFVV